MIEAKILQFWDQYKFLDNFHVYIPRLEDRVISSLPDHVAIYEEFVHDGLRFAHYPFIMNIVDLFWVVSA